MVASCSARSAGRPAETATLHAVDRGQSTAWTAPGVRASMPASSELRLLEYVATPTRHQDSRPRRWRARCSRLNSQAARSR